MRILYLIIHLGSWLLRSYYVPNPFEPLGEGTAFILNILFEPFLQGLSYWEVGLFYHSGDEPVAGSLMFLFAYLFNVACIWALCSIGIHWYTVIPAIVIYLAVLFLFSRSVYD